MSAREEMHRKNPEKKGRNTVKNLWIFSTIYYKIKETFELRAGFARQGRPALFVL